MEPLLPELKMKPQVVKRNISIIIRRQSAKIFRVKLISAGLTR